MFLLKNIKNSNLCITCMVMLANKNISSKNQAFLANIKVKT